MLFFIFVFEVSVLVYAWYQMRQHLPLNSSFCFLALLFSTAVTIMLARAFWYPRALMLAHAIDQYSTIVVTRSGDDTGV